MYSWFRLRVPFLDHEFVDFYLTIDPKLRKPSNDCMEKYLLKKFEGYLPDEVLWRQKRHFPMELVLKGVMVSNNSKTC